VEKLFLRNKALNFQNKDLFAIEELVLAFVVDCCCDK
jgi:hypothetical protein